MQRMAIPETFKLNKLLKWAGFIDPTYIGIDIESTSLIATELSFDEKNGWKLEKVGIAELPEDTIKNSEIHSANQLQQGLKAIKNKLQLSDYNSVIAASSKLISSHYSIIPTEPDKKKLAYQAFNETKKFFPEMYEELYVDHAIIEDEEIEKDDKQKLLLIAAQKSVLNPIIEATRKVEMPTKIIDTDYYALARSFELIKKSIKNDIVALLNVEANTALLVILENEKLIYHFHQGFNIPGYSQLIRYAIECIDPKAALEKINEKKEMDTIKLSPVLENQLTNQLQSILNTYTLKTNNPKLEQIILSGRTALIPHIDSLLKEKLGIDVNIVNPFKEITINTETQTLLADKLGPACLLCCGLAMRNRDENKY